MTLFTEILNKGKTLFYTRTLVATVIVLLLFALILLRMHWLQIDQHNHFSTLSQENHIKLLPLAPPRGTIYDRYGRVLAENVRSVDLLVDTAQVRQIDAVVDELQQLLPISEIEFDRFLRQRQRARRFEKITLKSNLDAEEMALFAINQHRFPGIELTVAQKRHYPYADLTAHVVGYVGRINEQDLANIDPALYAGTTHIGKTGLELQYEDVLHGVAGIRRVENNAAGRIIRNLSVDPAKSGNDLHLHLDIDLQRIATEALGEHNGSVVVIDVNNGGVLALVSKPSFDPNLFVDGISQVNYAELRDSPARPLFNRAVNGDYPPGSTVKPIIGLGALEMGVIDTRKSISCSGIYRLPGTSRTFRDWKRQGHGSINLDAAITQSCDVYFYELARNMGVTRFHDYLRQFRFGQRTGIDMPRETSSVLPSPEWKQRRFGESWYPGDTINIGIGQGYFQTSPMQLAYSTALLANGGKVIPPRLAARINEQALSFDADSIEQIEIINPGHWQSVIDGMVNVIEGPSGTARRLQNTHYRIAGKTGTAQVISIAQDQQYDASQLRRELHDHGLFIAFAPVENPQIAVAIIAENAGSGGSAAAPVAKAVMDAWLIDQMPVEDE